MAYTRSMRLKWGRKAPRSSRARRSRFPKRTFRRSRNAAYSSQRGNTTYMGFRGRKMPLSKYKRVLWNASTVAEHHRSVLMQSYSHVAPVTNTLANFKYYALIPDSFWSNAGGSIDNVTPDEDVFIRGGISTMRIRNNGDAPVHIVVWKIRTTSAGIIPAEFGNPAGSGVNNSAMFDPTVVSRFEQWYRVRQRYAFSIEPNDSNSLITRITTAKVNTSSHNFAHYRDYWIVSVNSSGSTAPNCTVNVGHNMSYTTDRV